MSKLPKIFTFLLVFSTLFGGLIYAQNAVTTHRNVYSFYYPKSDSILVGKLIEKTDPGIIEIENFFGAKSGTAIQIYLTRSQSDFQLYSLDGFPEWAQAITFVIKE